MNNNSETHNNLCVRVVYKAAAAPHDYGQWSVRGSQPTGGEVGTWWRLRFAASSALP